uniref:Uncharacterized protein n=1 Tax=Arundo donax TaxID=35708 RepID=A0A0A9HL29_ARUDO
MVRRAARHAGEQRVGVLGALLVQDLHGRRGVAVPRRPVALLLGRFQPRRHHQKPPDLRSRRHGHVRGDAPI